MNYFELENVNPRKKCFDIITIILKIILILTLILIIGIILVLLPTILKIKQTVDKNLPIIQKIISNANMTYLLKLKTKLRKFHR